MSCAIYYIEFYTLVIFFKTFKKEICFSLKCHDIFYCDEVDMSVKNIFISLDEMADFYFYLTWKSQYFTDIYVINIKNM